jgi:hypothetical protein
MANIHDELTVFIVPGSESEHEFRPERTTDRNAREKEKDRERKRKREREREIERGETRNRE